MSNHFLIVFLSLITGGILFIVLFALTNYNPKQIQLDNKAACFNSGGVEYQMGTPGFSHSVCVYRSKE